MWFGTLNGLNRYDGYDFKVFRYEADDPSSLSDNQIRSLYVDRDGVLWVGTWTGGLNRYDRITERFHRYMHDPDDPHSLSHNQVLTIYEDPTGTFWIGTDSGLNELDRDTGRFTRYLHEPDNPNSLSHSSVGTIVADETGALWIPTHGGGLNKLLPRERGESRRAFAHYRHDPSDPYSLSHDEAYGALLDRNGYLWVTTWGGGINRLDRQTGRFKHFRHDPMDSHSLGSDQVGFVLEDRRGSLWFTTAGAGLDKFDADTEGFTHYRHDPTDRESLSHDHIVRIFEDRAGALWVGTLGGGISVFDREKRQFVHYRNDPGNPDSEGKDEIRGIQYDEDGLLWLGAFGDGLVRIDRETDTFTHYRHDPANPNSLLNNGIWTLYGDRDGALWVGTIGGLGRFDRTSETFTNFRHDPADSSSLSATVVLSIYRDRSGVLWVGTFHGLNRFDDEKQAFTHYLHDPSVPDSLSHNAVMRILEDQAGELWIATWGGGLNRLDRDTGRFVSYRNDPEDPQSLTHDAVFSLHEDETGVLWVGTSHGLNRMVTRGANESPVFVRYTKDDGLPDSTILGILEDEKRNLWLSTNNGLSRFDPRTETFRNFDVTDGLQGNIFSQVDAYDRSSSGEMAFGGLNGFNRFYPDDIETNESVPPVVLTDFQLARRSVPIGDDSVPQKSITETQALTLTYEDRVLTFAFAALDFRAPTKNRYRYRLDGLEDDWAEVGSNARSVTYTNLAPGDYTFRVKGSNNHGVWNEEGASIHVTVTPPWWQTMWFRLLSMAAVVAALLTAHKARIGYIERRNVALESEIKRRERTEQALLRSEAALQTVAGQLIEAQEAERKRIAGELHDDLNQKLAALAIELDRLEDELPDADPLRGQIVGLEGRTAGLMEDVRRLSHRLHPATIEHVGLVAGLKSLCTEFGKDGSITVHVNLTEIAQSPSLDVALALYRIAQEALQNVWKYSGDNEVRVSLAEMEDGLQLVISDDGKGFDVDTARRKGLGLVSMEERVRHLNGEFHLSSWAGKGTRVDVRVPLIGKSLRPQ